MDKKKKLKRNLIIGLGTLTAIGTPVVVFVSKALNKKSSNVFKANKKVNEEDNIKIKPSTKKTPSKTPQKSEQVRQTLKSKVEEFVELIPGIDKSLKSDIIPIARDFLLNGIKSVKAENLDSLLLNVGLSRNIVEIIHSFLIKDGKVDDTLIQMLLRKGFSGLVDDKNNKYFDALMSKVINLLPNGITDKIPGDFIKKIFKGMSKSDFSHFIDSKLHLNVLTSSLAGTLYGEMPILKKGIILANGQDWKDTITGIIGDWNSFGTFIKGSLPKKAETQANWQMSTMISKVFGYLSKLNIKINNSKTTILSDITDGIGTFFNSGLDSMKASQIEYFINIFNWGKNFHQSDIFESEKQKLKTDLKKIIRDSNLKNKKRNPVDLSSIDKATTYNGIVDAAKSIRGYTKEIVGKIGDAISGLNSEKIYKSLHGWYITQSDIFGEKWYDTTLKGGIRQLFSNAVDAKRKDIDTDSILENIYNEAKKCGNDIWKLWPHFDALIKKVRSIVAYRRYNHRKRVDIDVDKFLKNFRGWHHLIIEVQKKLTGLFGSSNLNVNDKLNLKVFDHIFTIKGVLDQIDKFVKGKTLYKDKVITISPKEINISDKINEYLKNNVKKFHFHINTKEGINNYKNNTIEILKQLKTKKTKVEKVPSSLLDLTSLSKKEEIKDIHNEAIAILKDNISKGLFKNDNKTSLTLSQAEKLLPVVPEKELGFPLTKEFIQKKSKWDFKLKLINHILTHSKLISEFILEGIPKTEAKWEELKTSLSSIVKPILKEKGIDIPMNIIMTILDSLFDKVQEERKLIQESKNKQITNKKTISKQKK